jgi:tripartite-type tricarboxylate transporter receptor subunit TctC
MWKPHPSSQTLSTGGSRPGQARRRPLWAGLLAGCLACCAALAQAQEAPLRIVVGYAPGGSTDRVARIVADKLGSKLGTPVIVENKTGAGGRLSAQAVKAAPANQPTLLLANPAVMLVAPLVFADSGYDPERDFRPVSHVNSYEFGVAVSTAVPVRELPHLMAWLRANPDKANFGVPATGSLPHFFGLMVGDAAQVRAEVVGYRGSAPLLNDLLGGQVPVAFDTFDTLLPQHEAGKIRILAVSGAKRSPLDPKIPTFKEGGLNLAATGWNTFFAPMSMPKAQAERLAGLIHDVMKDPDTQRKFEAAKMTPEVATMAQTEAMLKAYRAQWAPVVQRSGFKP